MLDIQIELSIECSEKYSADWEQSSQFHSVWVLIGLEVSPHCTVVAQHPGHPGHPGHLGQAGHPEHLKHHDPRVHW